MFPGQGSQYAKMCLELFNNEPIFSTEAEKCFQIIQQQSGKNIKTVLFNDDSGKINSTEFTQPVLFII
ncbi:MAG: hypothetical protein C0490_26405, partial [Marivirga sp.]|nr:hypothetical protein [Marivirga sp.]